MANPSSITVTNCATNSAINQPSTQAIDTDGTVPIAAGGEMFLLILEIINAAAVALTVTIKAGDNPPAATAADLVLTFAATGNAGAKQIVGPFESARFLQDDGSVNVAFLAASSTPNATVRAYRLPKI
jgi:hypothetical protein